MTEGLVNPRSALGAVESFQLFAVINVCNDAVRRGSRLCFTGREVKLLPQGFIARSIGLPVWLEAAAPTPPPVPHPPSPLAIP